MSTPKTIKKIETYLVNNKIGYDYFEDMPGYEFCIGKSYSANWISSSDSGYERVMNGLRFEAVKAVALKQIKDKIKLTPLQIAILDECLEAMKSDLSMLG